MDNLQNKQIRLLPWKKNQKCLALSKEDNKYEAVEYDSTN